MGLFKGKQFDQGVDNLESKLTGFEKYMPEGWTSKKQDRQLLKDVAKNGLRAIDGIQIEDIELEKFPDLDLEDLKEFVSTNFPDLLQTYPDDDLNALEFLYFNRIQQICLIYKDF